MTAVHRIFLAPLRPDVDRRWAHEHWTTHHAGLFARTPGLRGYVQDRPPAASWPGRGLVCSETWFDDRPTERAAFESDHYLTDVAADEATFVQRDQAWHSVVTTARRARRTRTYRVLAFGHGPEVAAAWIEAWGPRDVDVLGLQRPAPLCSHPGALGLWTDDLDRARDAVAHFGPLCLLTRPSVVVGAPGAPWTATEPEESSAP